jgi:signal transduction histidine kinase
MIAEQTPNQHLDHFGKSNVLRTLLHFVLRWFEPRSTDRDEAFRERTIRVTVAVLLAATVLTIPTWLVYRTKIELISYQTLTLLMIAIFIASSVAVIQRRVKLAGQMLVLSLAVGAFGVTIIDGYWAGIVPPVFMLIILITALVLPRSTLLPAGAATIGIFSLIAFLQQSAGRGTTLVGMGRVVQAMDIIPNVFFLILVEVMFLRQLRLEFDGRLAAMSESIKQTEEARKEADRANQAKSRFLAIMSHELRTPLNAINGYVDLVLTGILGTLTERQTEKLRHVRHNSKRLLEMINDTLDMAKIEAGKVDVLVSTLSPRQTVQEIVDDMQSLAHQKNLTLTATFYENTPDMVVCDLPKLQQILTNLVGNAIKFTTEGGVRVEVGSKRPDHWYFKVIDTGVGMPEDAPSYIFETFTQVEGQQTRSHEGTGLGLAITKNFITYMGGTIEVETALGKGTTFTVVFPCQVKEIRQ